MNYTIEDMNNTVEKINFKMDKNNFDPLYSSDSDPGSDSENEETKPEEIKPEEVEKLLKKHFKNLVENNTHNLSYDIYDGIEDIFSYMDKHFINPKTAELSFFMEDRKMSTVEYNSYFENTINNIFSEIPHFLKPKLNKLREIMLEKYINKDTIEKVERFRKDGEFIHKSIVN